MNIKGYILIFLGSRDLNLAESSPKVSKKEEAPSSVAVMSSSSSSSCLGMADAVDSL